jgi:hypothetical protein
VLLILIIGGGIVGYCVYKKRNKKNEQPHKPGLKGQKETDSSAKHDNAHDSEGTDLRSRVDNNAGPASRPASRPASHKPGSPIPGHVPGQPIAPSNQPIATPSQPRLYLNKNPDDEII